MSYGGGYTTTSYGAQGGVADGGGFLGGGSQGGGGSQSAGGKGTYGKDTLRPVTIKQIIDAQQPNPNAEFQIDDVEISQVSFVGQIRNVSTQTTNITYKLDDGTGTIEVKVWIDTENNTMDIGGDFGDGDGGGNASTTSKPKLVENEWAHVWGKLKQFNSKRHVGAIIVRPIVDKMEIQYHLLESTAVHLYFTRGPLDQIKRENGGDVAMQEGGANGANGAGPGGEAGGSAQILSRMSPSAKQIFQLLKSSPQSNEGLHVQNIAAQAGLNVADVRKAGDQLLSSGLVFTTVDDETWAILEF